MSPARAGKAESHEKAGNGNLRSGRPSLALIVVLALGIVCSQPVAEAYADTHVSIIEGNWSSSLAWTFCFPFICLGTPSSGDTAKVQDGHKITVDGSFTVARLYVGATGINMGKLVFDSGSQLTITGTATLGQGGSGDHIIDMNSGGTLVVGTLAIEEGGNLDWRPGAGTVQLTANNTLPDSAFTTFNNLIIRSGTTKLSTDITVSGTLTVSSGAALDLNGHNVTCNAMIINGTGVSSAGALLNNSSVSALVTGPITLGSASSIGATGNITLGAGIAGGHDLTKVGAGTLNLGSAAAILGSLTIGAGALTSTSGIMSLSGNFTNNSSFASGNGTVSFGGSTAATIGGSSATTFYNIVIDKGAASTTITNTSRAFTASGDLSVTRGILVLEATDANYAVTGDLTVGVSGTLKHSVDWDTYARMLSVGGDLLISGAYDYSAVSRAHISMTGPGTKNISAPGTCLSILTLSAGDYYASGAFTINDNFWAMFGTASGSFHTNGQGVTANAALLNNGGTVYIDGGSLSVTGGLLVTTGSLAGVCSLGSGTLNADAVTIGSASTEGTFIHFGGTANIGALTISSTGTYTCTNSPAINISGNWTSNGIYTRAAETVTFNGAGAQSIGGTAASQSFYNLVVNKATGTVLSTGGSTLALNVGGGFTQTLGDFTAPPAMAVSGAVTLAAGTFTAGANLSVGGDWTNNGGIFTPGTGAVTFNGASAQVLGGTSGTTFSSLTLDNASGLTLGADQTVSSTLTLTSGKLATTPSHYIAVTSTSSGAVTGYSPSSYVNGSLQWSLASGGSYLFPVGDGSSYRPFELNGIACSSPVVRVATSSTGAATVDGTLTSVAARNWYAQLISGGFTSATVRITESGLNSTHAVASSSAQSGDYTCRGGNAIGDTVTSDAGISCPGSTYFAIGSILPDLTVVKFADKSEAVPGEVVTCTQTVTNTGIGTAGGVVVEAALSPHAQWGLDSYGTATPFLFTDGSTPSGLTPGTPVYSTDGGLTWTYAPVSGGTGAPAGYDGGVTNWRIPMNGSMNAGGSSFTVNYKVRVR